MPAPDDPEALEPLSGVDHAWLRMDEPSNLMIINGCLVLDRPLERQRLKSLLQKRLLPIRRFRQRILNHQGSPHWELDPGFDLDAHVLEMDLPAPGGDEALREVVSDLMSVPFGLDRPLWRFHVLHGYKGGSVVMGRLHHCIGDGMALLLVLLSLTDRTEARPRPPGSWRTRATTGTMTIPSPTSSASRRAGPRRPRSSPSRSCPTACACWSSRPRRSGPWGRW